MEKKGITQAQILLIVVVLLPLGAYFFCKHTEIKQNNSTQTGAQYIKTIDSLKTIVSSTTKKYYINSDSINTYKRNKEINFSMIQSVKKTIINTLQKQNENTDNFNDSMLWHINDSIKIANNIQ